MWVLCYLFEDYGCLNWYLFTLSYFLLLSPDLKPTMPLKNLYKDSLNFRSRFLRYIGSAKGKRVYQWNCSDDDSVEASLLNKSLNQTVESIYATNCIWYVQINWIQLTCAHMLHIFSLNWIFHQIVFIIWITNLNQFLKI